MSEEQKVNIAKAKLPIKTKIAVWWLFSFGLIGTVAYFILLFTTPLDTTFSAELDFLGRLVILVPIIIIAGLLYIVPAWVLTRKNKIGLIISIAMLCIALVSILVLIFMQPCYLCISHTYLYPLFLTYLIPFTLIIVDARNYLAMIRQREVADKEKENAQSTE